MTANPYPPHNLQSEIYLIYPLWLASALPTIIIACKSEFIITADEGVRGGKIIPLKNITDKALSQCENIKKCIVVKRTGNKVNFEEGRDIYLMK